ncbi:ATP-grasp domain-containing protein [Bacteroides nordii]|uniref:ATP-grasp domain-containing protein n=1 Tax=Bacteroides nordii TaxID=291645 RepID=UPI00095986DE|nr:ATP-grasp domain-containing protein [Bacteroides nordii]MCE8465159.1 ATP-grasp domain-containing protein [Bacteroides nordii]OKZ08152.1 MAG: hypothetical protein BHV71_03165 [Bacteroides sp. 41_26]UYU50802.1 ATP-grasp domain-containing protein [Bacteroides nordii]
MNILLTSVGRRTYMIEYFRKALASSGLVHASNSVLTYSLKQADKYVLSPQIYDDSYIDFLLSYCNVNNINAIISLFDIDLPILAKNKKRFTDCGIQLVVSNELVTKICNDKWHTYNFLKGIGINQSPTYISLKEAQDALNDHIMKFPLIIKPRWGMASIGVLEANNIQELNVLYQKLIDIIFNSYLKFESNSDIHSCILIQEKIVGDEFGLDILNDLQGNYVTTIAKHKLAMRSGETDIAQIVDSTMFIPISQNIANHLCHIANLDVDCFVAPNGNIYVLEMNCRFGGQYPFSHLSGVDFPKQIINWLQGGKTDISLLSPQIGVMGCKELCPVVLK